MLALYAIALLLFGWLLYRLYLDPLSRIPGPLIAKFFPIYYIRGIHNCKHNFYLKDLHDTYGPVIRLGPSDVSFATTSAFDSIYGSGADRSFAISGSRRSMLVNAEMIDVMLSSCLETEPRNWLRPLITTTLSAMTGPCLEWSFDAAFEEGLKIYRFGQVSTPIDLSTYNKDLMWALGSLIASGKHPAPSSRSNFDACLDNIEYFSCFLEICYCFFDRLTVLKHQPAFQHVWWTLCSLVGMNAPRFGMEDEETVTFEKSHYALLKSAANRSEDRKIGDHYLQMNSHSTKLSIYGISDSSVNAVFYFLLKNPRCLKKVEEELFSTFRSYEEISLDGLARLPYLHACIDEALRMAPPFSAGLLQRISKGVTLDGIYIPAGTGVTVDQYSLGHSEEHWESAHSFLPERWLDPNARKNEKASRPFLIGTRQCPGRTMTYQILQLAVGKVVYLYEMELMNKEFDITLHSSSRIAWTGVDLQVILKPRDPSNLGYN